MDMGAPLGVPQGATFAPGPFALHHFPGQARLSPRVHQPVIVTPAQHKTHGKGRERAEPHEAFIAAVKDVDHQAPPELGPLAQKLAFLIAHPGFPRPRARS